MTYAANRQAKTENKAFERGQTEPVPPTMTTALEANSWTYGVDTQVLKALEART